MKTARVKRSHGPKAAMTEATYRKKALPHLLADFNGLCAYCLDPKEFRAASQSNVEHFDCKIRGRERHYYKNLMLACAACNMSKHDKPVVNPFDSEQRLLNCTEENEFLGHIRENSNGQWESTSKAGHYHLASIGLTADCHNKKRKARAVMANRIFGLLTTAIQYKTVNPEAVHHQLMGAVRDLLQTMENFPPIVTENGVFTVKEWLKSKGVDLGFLDAPASPTRWFCD